MYKSTWNLRNFKKCLRLVEEVSRQDTDRDVNYVAGYAVATIKERRKRGRITRNQEKALIDLVFEAANETVRDILKDEEDANRQAISILDFDADTDE